jgi:hypothetical protein
MQMKASYKGLLADVFRFRGRPGETITAHDVRVRWQTVAELDEPECTQRFDLRCVVSFATYEVIDRDALFHLDQEKRGPTFGGAFYPGKDVEMDLRLAQRHWPLVNAFHASSLDELRREFLAIGSDHVLLDSNSYYGLYVKQRSSPELAVGYRTDWAEL